MANETDTGKPISFLFSLRFFIFCICLLIIYFSWQVQAIGEAPPTGTQVGQVHRLMADSAGSRGGYLLTENNCTQAQEGARRALGMQVQHPYRWVSWGHTILEVLGLVRD